MSVPPGEFQTNCLNLLVIHKIKYYLSREINGDFALLQKKHGLVVRGLLAILALVMLAFTLSAYLNTANNPALANLSGDTASLGSVAGAFLGRQLSLSLIALYGAIRGTTQPLLIGAFAIAFLNLHDAVFLSAFGTMGPGAIAGLILGSLALLVIVLTSREAKA